MKANKIILINTGMENPFKEGIRERYKFPPYGLLSIASILSTHGYVVRLFDFFFESISKDNFISELRKFSNEILAVGITTYTESFHLSISIAKVAKHALPNASIIFGGIHASFLPKDALENEVVDYVVRGEGESKIIPLLEYIKHKNIINLNMIRGISYKSKSGEIKHTMNGGNINNIDCLPFPSYNLNKDYPIVSDTLSIITSRGCPGKCIFCASKAFNDNKYRMHSAFWIFSLIHYFYHINNKYTMINFLDDTFTVNKKRLKQFYELLKYNNINLIWTCKSRTDSLDERTIKLLYKNGCRSIHLGIESGEQHILDSIDKNIKHEDNLNVIKLCNKYAIRVECSFMIGLPEDTRETIDKTLILASEIMNAKIGLAYIGIATPYPGTQLYRNSDYYGMEYISHNWKDYTTKKPIYFTKNFSIEDIRKAYYIFDFDKTALNGINIISSCDISDYRNGIRKWVDKVISVNKNKG